MPKKKKTIPKRHRFKVGDKVVFYFAGSFRTGAVDELTNESDGHATYIVKCLARGRIYPCLGIDESKDYHIMSKETRETFSNDK